MIKRIAQAWGFAAIILLPGYVDLTSSLGDERMHVPWPLTRLVLAQLVDLAIVGLVFAASLAILRGLKSWTRIRWFALAFLPIYLLVCNLRIFPFRVPYLCVANRRRRLDRSSRVSRFPRTRHRVKTLWLWRRRAHRLRSLCFSHDRSTGKRRLLASRHPGIERPYPRASQPPNRAWFGSSSTSWHISRYSRHVIPLSIFPTSIGYARKARCTPT